MPLRPARQPGPWGSSGKRFIGFILAAIIIAPLSSCTPKVQEGTPTFTPGPRATRTASRPSLGAQVLTGRGCAEPLDVGLEGEGSICSFGGGPLSDGDIKKINELAAYGFKIDRTILWWDGFNLLDVYYDESIQQRLDMLIDFHFYGAEPGEYYGQSPGIDQPWSGLDPQKLWAVTLDNEGPGGFKDSQFYGALSEDIAKYADIYYAETGHALKPMDQLTGEEYIIFNEWLNEKTVWVYNYVYDYVKAHWPHLQVNQGLMMAGIWGKPYDIGAPYEVRSDTLVMDCYYAANQPWFLYEAVRRYKLIAPDKLFTMILWGVIWDFSQMEEGKLVTYREGSLEQFRREAWITYLAGADSIGWFNWGPQGPGSQDWRSGWQRTDPEGRQTYAYTDALSRQLHELPVFKPRPVVLAVVTPWDPLRDIFELDIFTEYDSANERTFAFASLDLSQYRLIVMTPGRYRDETVAKLNQYVESGGNVIFLGGLVDSRNVYNTGPRDTRLQIEDQATESFESGRIRIAIAQPNPLGLELAYDGLYHETYLMQFDTQNEDYRPIDGFNWVNDDGTTRPTSGYSLVLYHDESKPGSGWVLYSGTFNSWQDADHDPEDRSDIYYLHREVFRAFANFIGIGEAVASPETQDMIITQGMLENGMLLAGIGNLKSQERSLTYRVNLSRFDLPAGEYWVYSLDEGASLGSFTTDGTMLEVPLTVVPNGTRLLLISRESFDPDFSVEIFPEIPQLGP